MSILSGVGQTPSVFNQGQETTITSFNGGGNLPISPATLASGTTYTFINYPFPNGYGIYGYSINFDLTGDATTSFTRISTLSSQGIGGLVYGDNDFLIGTTLPSTTTFNFSYFNANQFTPYPASPPNLYISFTPTFTGTAPTITSAYIKFFKLTN